MKSPSERSEQHDIVVMRRLAGEMIWDIELHKEF